MQRIYRSLGPIALAWIKARAGIRQHHGPADTSAADYGHSHNFNLYDHACPVGDSATICDCERRLRAAAATDHCMDSSDPTKVTVSPTGVVTGVLPRTATITASVDGKSGTSTVTVLDGGVVSSTGGVLRLQSGTVQISVPPDALASDTNLSVAPLPSGSSDPRVIKSAAFEFGPAGTMFAKPIVIRIKYDASNLAPGTEQAALELYLSTNSGWQVVAGSTVDLTAKVVSVEVSHFSAYALLTPPAVAAITIDGPIDRPIVNGANSIASVISTP